jgi:hypothetical protein
MVKKRKKAIQATFLAWMAFSGRVVFWEIYPVKTSENVFHLNVEIPLLTDDAWQDHIFAVECIFCTQGDLECLGHLRGLAMMSTKPYPLGCALTQSETPGIAAYKNWSIANTADL